MKRRPFTLIEVLVATALLGMLLSFLFALYGQLQKQQRELAERGAVAFTKRHVRARLGDAFQHVLFHHSTHPFFYVEEPDQESHFSSLVFLYDGGVDRLPHFADALLGRLMLNERRELCLLSWPYVSAPPLDYRMKKEVLLEEVEALAFRFYRPPLTYPIDDQAGWKNHWSLDEKELPALLEVEITWKKKLYVYRWILPHSGHHHTLKP